MIRIVRVLPLVVIVALGLVSMSRSCGLWRSSGPIVLANGRIVSGNGSDQTTRFVAIDDGRISAVGFVTGKDARPKGGRTVDVNGLFIAAVSFDRSAKTMIDGIRHVWVGHVNAGDPGNVVIMRTSPARIRPGYVPETDAIVAAVVDGVYYTARQLNTPR